MREGIVSLDTEWHGCCRKIAKCRACGLPCGYRPRPFVPPVGYRRGGICFVQINPGHIGTLTATEIKQRYLSEYGRALALRKVEAAKRLHHARESYVEAGTRAASALQVYREELLSQMREAWGWPPGAYGRMIEAHGVELDQVAVINLAQCPVPRDGYRRRHLETCWQRWTCHLLECLAPAIVIAQGRQVSQFLSCHELPGTPRLLEGVHHASRASRTSRDSTLAQLRAAIAPTSAGG